MEIYYRAKRNNDKSKIDKADNKKFLLIREEREEKEKNGTDLR